MNLFRKLMTEAEGGTDNTGATGATPTNPNPVGNALEAGLQPEPVKADAQTTWPSDWRSQIADKNDKELKQLERYSSPKDIWVKARALEQRLSSGELKAVTPYPDNGTPEQQNAWRAEQGIPETPDKYELNLGEGVVIAEQDKPLIDDFLKSAHASNVPAATATAAVKWYFDYAERQAQARHDADMQAKQTFEDTMRTEWGNEYRSNINQISAILDQAPQGLKDRFMGARMPDGTPFGSDPDTLRWLSNLARTINPVVTVTPGSGANITQAVSDEINVWKGKMADKSSDYWKGPSAETNQARYRQLLEHQQRTGGKA